MIRLRGVTFTYPGSGARALEGVDLDVPEGGFLLVAGASGTGKSTLLRVPSGLVPHHSGGTLEGSVRLGGREILGTPPRELAGRVAFVPQDPEAHGTADRVLPELAFAMENLGVPAVQMRKRIEEVLDHLGIAHLRERRLDTLSGGERQRVAIAAVLAVQPDVLIADEPTSSLDPGSAEEVLSVLVRLRDELGLTVLCSEHRLERVAAFADRVCFLTEEGRLIGDPRTVFGRAPYAPPVCVLGRALGWEPLPLTVREGRGFARELQATPPVRSSAPPSAEPVLACEDLHARAGPHRVLRGVDLGLGAGELHALVGRNGSGKTTLLRTIVGLGEPTGGRATLGGDTLSGKRPSARSLRRVAYLPQRAESLLFRSTVAGELRAAAGERRDAERWLHRLGLGAVADRHPWTLSAGQRLWVALATAFVRRPDVYLLDEPTRGLDPQGKERLAALLREEADRGAAVLLVTHDVELVARAADRVSFLADGQIVASGPVHEVLGESLLFSSQTSKVMRDPGFLTPADVVGSRAR